MNGKSIRDLKVRTESLKLLEESIDETLAKVSMGMGNLLTSIMPITMHAVLEC